MMAEVRCGGQKAKYSRRADVFRFTPENGHGVITPSCPRSAANDRQGRSPMDVTSYSGWRGGGNCPNCTSALRGSRKTTNIQASSRAIWGIPAYIRTSFEWENSI